MSASQFQLLKERRFGPFFVTQFLGAFNDNLYKNAMMILLAFQGAALTSMSSDLVIQLSGAIFILPFFLFSATAGQLADKYDKATMARLVKLVEIGIMIIGAAGFYFQSLVLLWIALFLMGLHSTVFGPIKYAILPQHLQREEIIGGNGMVEMGTYVAILLGTILGGVLIGMHNGGLLVSGAAIAVALAGYLSSRSIPAAGSLSPELVINWNIFTETARNLRFAKTNRTVFLSILGISWFWLYGVVFLSQFPNLTKTVLHGDETVVSLLLALFSIGVGVGSLLCERLSGRTVEIGLVPLGAIGLTIFGIDFYFATSALPSHATMSAIAFFVDTQHLRLIIDLCLIGLFGGLYIVPLYALIQVRSDPEHRSRIIAGNNIINAAAMVLSVGLVLGLLALGCTIPEVLLATAILNAVVAIYIFTLVPEFLMRFLIWMLVHTVYRLEKYGIEAIPEQGPAVLVCNHVSLVDALIVAAACPRPVRFVIDHRIYRLPLLHFIFRIGKAIPIAPAKEDPRVYDQAFETMTSALQAGDLVCIFPEGALPADGEVGEFKPGLRKILDRTPVPVIPLALRGLWGSFFSRKDGPAMRRPRGVLSRIGLRVGQPVPAEAAQPDALRQQVIALRGEAK